jgi:hypothetical protein
VNERGGKEDKRRKKHSREDFWIFGGVSIILREERTVLLVWGWSSLLEDGFFCLRNLLEFGGLRQGAPVAGSFGLGGQESLRILELGSRRGSVPSWLGG